MSGSQRQGRVYANGGQDSGNHQGQMAAVWGNVGQSQFINHGFDRDHPNQFPQFTPPPVPVQPQQQPTQHQNTQRGISYDGSNIGTFQQPQNMIQVQRAMGRHQLQTQGYNTQTPQTNVPYAQLPQNERTRNQINIALSALTGPDRRRAEAAVRYLESTEVGKKAFEAWKQARVRQQQIYRAQAQRQQLAASNYPSPGQNLAQPVQGRGVHPAQSIHRQSAMMRQVSPGWPTVDPSRNPTPTYQGPGTRSPAKPAQSPAPQQPQPYPITQAPRSISIQNQTPQPRGPTRTPSVQSSTVQQQHVLRYGPAQKPAARSKDIPQTPSPSPQSISYIKSTNRSPTSKSTAPTHLPTGATKETPVRSAIGMQQYYPSIAEVDDQEYHKLTRTKTNCILLNGFETEKQVEEWATYRVNRSGTRYMKNRLPPQGTYRRHQDVSIADYSDPRDFHAPSTEEQDLVWKALEGTCNSFFNLTGRTLEKKEMCFLDEGYNAAWDEIKRKTISWMWDVYGQDKAAAHTENRTISTESIRTVYKPSREVPGYAEIVQELVVEQQETFQSTRRCDEFIKDGVLIARPENFLFKLKRWYGLIEDYIYAPNYPMQLRTTDQFGRLVQNPDAFACRECIEANVLCHGHRESVNGNCIPCAKAYRKCSKEKHRQMIPVEASFGEGRKRKFDEGGELHEQKDDRDSESAIRNEDGLIPKRRKLN